MLAGLASLPIEPYEAAAIDGASAWRQFRDLTLPFLKPVIAIAFAPAHHGRAQAVRPCVSFLTGGGPAEPDQNSEPVHLSGGVPLCRPELCRGNLALRACFATVAFSSWFIKRMRLAE
jgi:multiple sugar transport system permease protein